MLMDSMSYGPSTLSDSSINGEAIPWQQFGADPDMVVREGRFWYENFGAFLLFMIPVAVIWLWSIFKNESDGKPVKRKSRLL